MLVMPDNKNMKKKGSIMKKTKKKMTIVTSSGLESGWAIGVGIIAGQLST